MENKGITPVAVRVGDLPKLFPMSERQAYNIFKGIKEEINRIDSKLDPKAYIQCGNLKYMNLKAVYWYLENKDRLKDETARVRVNKFNAKDYNNIL